MSVQVTKTTLPAQVAGSDIFSGQVNIFDLMSNLTTAIQNGDKTAIDDAVNQLGQFDDNVRLSSS